MKPRRVFLNFLLVAAFAGMTLPSLAQATRKISLSQLEDMFANMRAKTRWNVDGPLLWGYFFFDSSSAKLKRASTELEALGYRVVGIQPVQGGPQLRLHVEKVEVHTPATLHARNVEFYALAERLTMASYDGMDVGPAPATIK